jgi:hypothetical protein
MKSPRFPVVQPIILLVLSSTLAIGCAMPNTAPGGSDETEADPEHDPGDPERNPGDRSHGLLFR